MKSAGCGIAIEKTANRDVRHKIAAALAHAHAPSDDDLAMAARQCFAEILSSRKAPGDAFFSPMRASAR